jgi:DNA-binding Lrp family transcriptional regulator
VKIIASGKNSASKIAKTASPSEGTVYNYLETLLERGIIEKDLIDGNIVYEVNLDKLKKSNFSPNGKKDIWELHTEREEIKEIISKYISDGGVSGQDIFNIMKEIERGQKEGKFNHLNLPKDAIKNSKGVEGVTPELGRYFMKKYQENWAENSEAVLRMGMDVNLKDEPDFDKLME